MTVGERLRFIRKVRGMPQHELASKVKLSANRIAQYETDYRVPRKKLLQQLAMVLGVDPRFFIATAPNDLTDVIRLLFWLETMMPDTVSPIKLEGKDTDGASMGIYLRADIHFCYLMQNWLRQRKAWQDGSITDDEYFAWKMEYDLSGELIEK